MALYGIEQEIPLLRPDGSLADSSNTTFAELQSIIDQLPEYAADRGILHIGDAGIKRKRWYVEGYERFAEDGSSVAMLPKAIEIRTPPRPTIGDALADLRRHYLLLRDGLAAAGFKTTWISHHPFQSTFDLDPPLNAYERKLWGDYADMATDTIAQRTFGPDLNFSLDGMDDAALIDAGKKLTYYSPFIVPFSFSAPFEAGRLWEGLSLRTYVRTGRRPAVRVFLHDQANMLKSVPSLTQESELPANAGRIEFKAFDTCHSLALYDSLFHLLIGILEDTTLPGRALTPDAALHQRSARHGFSDELIRAGARQVLDAVPRAGGLRYMLEDNRLPVHDLIDAYHATQSIPLTLEKFENLDV